MTEELVSFELAKKLKEIGFDVECYNQWERGERSSTPDLWELNGYGEAATEYYAAPRLSLAQKWFREVHKISVQIVVSMVIDSNEWSVDFYYTNGRTIHMPTIYKKTYEEALEAGLLKACDLIEKK